LPKLVAGDNDGRIVWCLRPPSCEQTSLEYPITPKETRMYITVKRQVIVTNCKCQIYRILGGEGYFVLSLCMLAIISSQTELGRGRVINLKWLAGGVGIVCIKCLEGETFSCLATASPPGWGLDVGLTTPPCKKENCWEASKKFSQILRRRPRPTLGCGAEKRRRNNCLRFLLGLL
jgi:hypothetical protein